MRTRNALKLLASIWIAVLLAPLAGAQGGKVGSLLGSGSAAHEVDAGEVGATANASFAAAVDRLLGLGAARDGALAGADRLGAEQREELAGRAVEEFRSAMERELSELGGDGVLFAEEVTGALGRLREERLEELRQQVEAEASGRPPPPRAEPHASAWAHHRAMLRYVFLERNTWLDWGVLVAAALAGLALAVGVLKASSWKLGERGGGRGRRSCGTRSTA